MKKIFFVIAIAVFIVCVESNPRDDCEEHRMRNGTDLTGEDCLTLYMITNIDDANAATSQEVKDRNRNKFNTFIFNQCLQSSLAAAKCRKIKPGFSNR